MKVVKAGHMYILDHLDGSNYSTLHFVNRGHSNNTEGVTNQEVLRVLIDRIKFLDSEVEWYGNKEILQHLRQALVLHEARHLCRATEKGKILPEEIELSTDSHYLLQRNKI